jgi:2-polyprenyl-3-methyl-5-hydroxy-6-metoxy-1,4-benzoquinol methylase
MGNKMIYCVICEERKSFICRLSVKNTRNEFKEDVFRYYSCPSCSVMLIYPTISLKNIESIYDKEYYTELGSPVKNSFVQKILQIKFFSSYEEFTTSYRKKNGKLLDIGCGTGEFVKNMKSRGYDTFGLEPYSESVKLTRKLIGKEKVIRGYIKDIRKFPNSFDIITMWHVLEHTYEPLKEVKMIYQKLNEDGLLIFEVPSSDSFVLKLFKDSYTWHMVPEHNIYFTKKSLIKLLKKSGFSIIKIYSPPRALLNLSYSLKSLMHKKKYSKEMILFVFYTSIPLSVVTVWLSSLVQRGEVIRVVASKNKLL